MGGRWRIGPGAPDCVELGRLLERERKRRGLPARQVAAVAGVSDVYVRLVERGLRSPSQRTADAMLRAVGLESVPDGWTLQVALPDGEHLHLEWNRRGERPAERNEEDGMDPDETLRLLRLTIKQMRVDDNEAVRAAHADEVAEYIEALDGWLSGGGFPPAVWKNGWSL